MQEKSNNTQIKEIKKLEIPEWIIKLEDLLQKIQNKDSEEALQGLSELKDKKNQSEKEQNGS